MSLPLDPEEAPWTDEYEERMQERRDLYRERMIEQSEELAWNQYHLLSPS